MKRLYLLLLAVCTFACNNGDEPTPSSQITGDIIGKVTLFGEAGSCDAMNDHSGVKVSITINGKQKTVESDAKGFFVFEAVPRGTYEILYEKEKFGPYYQYSVKHLGGEATVLSIRVMAAKSTLKYSSVNYTGFNNFNGYNGLTIQLAQTSISESYLKCRQYNFIVCINDSPDVSISNYKQILSKEFIGYLPDQRFDINFFLTVPELQGKKIYIKVYNTPYIESTAGADFYNDIYKDMIVFPSANEGSSVLSTTIF